MSLDNYTRLINNYGLNKKSTKDKKLVPTTKNPIGTYQKNLETVEPVVEPNGENIVSDVVTDDNKQTQGATEVTQVAETPTSVDDSWKAIQQQIKMNTLNSKNEVAMAQRQASKNMDNYLKSLGIYGTGLGQSSYVDLATKYANQLADINADERTALLEAQQTQNAEVKELIENGADPMTIQQVISELKAQGFNTSEIERYQKAMGQDIETYAKSLYGTMLDEMKLEDFKGDKTLYNEAITMLENAITSGDSKAMNEAYKYAYNIANGTPNLNNETDNDNETKTTNTNISNPLNLQKGTWIYRAGTPYAIYQIKEINSDGTVEIRWKGDLTNEIVSLEELTKELQKEESISLTMS